MLGYVKTYHLRVFMLDQGLRHNQCFRIVSYESLTNRSMDFMCIDLKNNFFIF